MQPRIFGVLVGHVAVLAARSAGNNPALARRRGAPVVLVARPRVADSADPVLLVYFRTVSFLLRSTRRTFFSTP